MARKPLSILQRNHITLYQMRVLRVLNASPNALPEKEVDYRLGLYAGKSLRLLVKKGFVVREEGVEVYRYRLGPMADALKEEGLLK